MGEKAWKTRREWTCRATPRRVRRRWCWRKNLGMARRCRAEVGRDGSSRSSTSTGTRWIRCRSPTCRTNKRLAGAAPHRAKIRPLVHHATVGKPAHAILAAWTFSDLALTTALCTEHRGRIRKPPGAPWANQQHAKEDQHARPPHLLFPFGVVETLSHQTKRQSSPHLLRPSTRAQ